VRPAALVAIALAVVLAAPGCRRKKQDDGTTPMGAAALPELVLRDDAANVMLTWIDGRGDTHVELHPADVPAEGRSLVRVVVADREDGTRDLFYVVDLAQKRPDGTYVAKTMRRSEWEAILEKRREGRLGPPPGPAAAAPPSGAPGPGPTGPSQQGTGKYAGLTVIVYGAEWCRPCHEAQAFLKAKGVTVVMKDVESDPGAQAELSQKLRKAGVPGGSIPVIDVRGQLLVGYSPSALEQALAKASAGTML
jgi:glutaredoxin